MPSRPPKVIITTPMKEHFKEAASAAGLVTKEDHTALRSRSQSKSLLVLRRQVAHTLHHQHGYSLNEIAALLGYRHHTSIINLLTTPGRTATNPHPLTEDRAR